MELVIDKSFLWNAERAWVHRLLDLHTVLMPDVLFYEMMKDDEERGQLFARLPSRPNAVALLHASSILLQYEIAERRAVGPLSNHVLKGEWRFNPDLAKGTFVPEQWMLDDADIQRAQFLQSAEGVAQVGAMMPVIFPALKRFRPGSLKFAGQFALAEHTLGENDEVVRHLYRMTRHHSWPGSSRVHRRTALFRLIQLHALSALSCFRRYGSTPPDGALKKALEHDARDREYAMAATLCGAIATKDKGLAKLVSIAEPTALIIGMGPTRAIRGRTFQHRSAQDA
jgi:hypothetical protein